VSSSVDIQRLSPAERLALIEELWESLDKTRDVSLTDSQREELDRRAEALDAGELETQEAQEVLRALRDRAAR